VQRFSLAVVAGPDQGKSHLSSGARTVIGTLPSCDLVLSDPTVSRLHCEISIEDGTAVLRDFDSKNGTFISGIGIAKAYLVRSTELTLGGTRVAIELLGDSADVSLSQRAGFGLLVGRSEAMRAVFAQLEAAADSDVAVLLEGEPGTGKDLAAESLHRESSRRDGPIVVVDCRDGRPGQLERELFGCEAGAAGQQDGRAGALEAAADGTLLLDEIGQLVPDLQRKLAQALEARAFQRTGGGQARPLACRVVSATSRSLQREVNARRFRSDLYARIAVVRIRLPPLRERADDLTLLLAELVAEWPEAEPALVAELRSPARIEQLARYPWPGNVRELREHVERFLSPQPSDPFAPAALAVDPPPIDPARPLREQRERWTAYFERAYLARLLREHGGNVTSAARAAGVARVHLYRLLGRTGWKRT
jgi:DNA-binding NtrC family response regulator